LAPYAEFGIILLLFSVGLELSFDRLWAMRKQVLGLGAAELLVAALVLGIGLKMMGQSAVGSVGLGFALSMSSTALVLPIAGSTTPVGRAALAMLLFEDLALVPIIFLLGALAPRAGGADWVELAQTLGYGALVVAILMVFGPIFCPTCLRRRRGPKAPNSSCRPACWSSSWRPLQPQASAFRPSLAR
jgi:CPA2 family monovalent cation:H+ antiporter-2